MTETTNDEQSRYAWARRPTAKNDTEPDVPEGYGVPEGRLEPEDDAATAPLAAGPYPTAPQTTQPAGPQQGPYAAPPQSWASPRGSYPAPSAPTAPVGQPAAGTGVAEPTTGQPGGHPGGQPGTPGLSFGYPAPDPATGAGPAGPPGQFPPVPTQRDPRRPGWGGVVGVGVGAAVLSALLTAGLINATTDDNVSPSSTTTAQSVPAPVKTSTVSNPDWSAVAKAVEPSVVSVQVQSQTESGEGSGVILNKSGEIVTNNHVVAGVSEGGSVQVILNDGRSYTASVVGTDSQTDLAVIKIKNPPSDLTPATLGTSSTVSVGDPVMAVGNPLGLAGTVTTGIVSATDRPTTTSTSESQNPFGQSGSGDDVVITNAIQTDAAVNPGNSGGALVDVQGRVIGVPSSIASLGSSSSSSQSGSIGLGFAIPIDEVKTVAAQLAKGQTVQHSYLGVSLSEGTVTVDGAGREAATISSIVSGGPADKAGLKKGDSVIAVDGEQVNSYTSLVGQLREREPGASVKLTVVRDGKSIDVSVTLGTKPSSGS